MNDPPIVLSDLRAQISDKLIDQQLYPYSKLVGRVCGLCDIVIAFTAHSLPRPVRQLHYTECFSDVCLLRFVLPATSYS
ncbi:hypothetical protein RRG08_049047 [Elysia crispata]|uniref:Uncharacterized protein n=1 Tax=Elysia crispata TaxID=231223 RepID=A0AAE0YS28_9GAST|nr:hypothetical protein RRG08_049047 [Elysia crispata]